MNRDVIVCDDLRGAHGGVASPRTRRLNEGAYDRIMEGSSASDLTADRRFAFALIQPNRDWILSAESESQCKQWVALFSKLVQGRPVHRGYLVKRGKNVKSWKKRYFVLFENKVLNYYHTLNIGDKGALIGDIDLRHSMWLQKCDDHEYSHELNVCDFFGGDDRPMTKRRSKSILSRSKSGKSLVPKPKIRRKGRRQKSATLVDAPDISKLKRSKSKKHGTHFQSRSWGKRGDFGIGASVDDAESLDQQDHEWGQKQQGYFLEVATPNRTWIFCAESEPARDAWYGQIQDVFSDKLKLKIYFDSPCNVEILHNGQRLRDRYVALLKGWLILFRDKDTLNAVRRMTFFSDTIFRDYVRTQNCQTIPLRDAEIVRNFKSVYGQWSFEVAIGDRCWYFGVDSLEILSQWLHLLTRRDDVDFSHFEQSYSNVPCGSATDDPSSYIFSPNERIKKGFEFGAGGVSADYNLIQLQEAREPPLGDEEEEEVVITDIDSDDGGEHGDDEREVAAPLTPRVCSMESAGSPKEAYSEPIAIPSRHNRTRSKVKGPVINVGGMDQAPFTLVKPVATQSVPKLSWNSSSGHSNQLGDSLQYSCNLDTTLEDIDTPIQSMDEWNSSFTREIKL